MSPLIVYRNSTESATDCGASGTAVVNADEADGTATVTGGCCSGTVATEGCRSPATLTTQKLKAKNQAIFRCIDLQLRLTDIQQTFSPQTFSR